MEIVNNNILGKDANFEKVNFNTIEIPQILYYGSGKYYRAIHRHQHSFYQLEYCISGCFEIEINNQTKKLRAGDYAIIPPNIFHYFRQISAKLEFITIKFSVHNDEFKSYQEYPVTYDDITTILLSQITAIVKDNVFAEQTNNKLISYILADLLYHLHSEYLSVNEKNADTCFLACFEDYVLKNGARVNVNMAASFFNISVSQLKYRFQRAIQGAGSIKKYIDNLNKNTAIKYLCYSSMSLEEISSNMGFSSVYAFSRFFKRQTGFPPGKYRQK